MLKLGLEVFGTFLGVSLILLWILPYIVMPREKNNLEKFVDKSLNYKPHIINDWLKEDKK